MGFIFKPWNRLSLFTRIMIGFVLGILVGLVFGPQAAVLNPLGTILTRLLTMVVAPMVLCLLVVAAADVGDGKKLGRMGVKTVAAFLISTAFAIVVGLFFANLFHVGTGVDLSGTVPAVKKSTQDVSLIGTLVNIIPSNPFQSLAQQNLLQIIFFALILGFCLMKMGSKGEPLLNIFRVGKEVMGDLTNRVLEFTPYGVFGLMATVVGKNGSAIMIPYLKCIAALYLSGFLYVIIVQAGVMGGLIGHISPLRFLRTMKEAMAFVFATCSSVATIPINLKCTKNLGVDEDTANFIIPFGAVMNMNGTAIYEAVAVVFTAEIFGIHLSATDQLMVMVSATLAAIGTAGIPGSGLVMLTIVLSAAHLPMEAIGLLAGIDRILNMGRVIPNIVGDAASAVVIAKSEGTLKKV
ncbi:MULTISPECIES: dicarboxylate/amino acid:cation symporter [Acidaminococcus]|jgi:Na+/H+-dicarboxylate symporter|uniref:dicarboxylate/amino acid:cation symporter n=1 Tax=Acidaminococcus TaxID=904 RepID=UPI002591D1D5|nr:dicarboxylate/amino acid:cation symporter [Acidaminococcus sp.]MDO5598291.1 dicarboxylate/amino acid:cation symporter [Acidaminococcus sp.]